MASQEQAWPPNANCDQIDNVSSQHSKTLMNSATLKLDNKGNEIIHDSSLSIYERLRHFLFINFVLNKRSFVLSVLSYLADLVLFLSLNLYLFSNKKYIYETMSQRFTLVVSSPPSETTDSRSSNNLNSTQTTDANNTHLINIQATNFFRSQLNATLFSGIYKYLIIFNYLAVGYSFKNSFINYFILFKIV